MARTLGHFLDGCEGAGRCALTGFWSRLGRSSRGGSWLSLRLGSLQVRQSLLPALKIMLYCGIGVGVGVGEFGAAAEVHGTAGQARFGSVSALGAQQESGEPDSSVQKAAQTLGEGWASNEERASAAAVLLAAADGADAAVAIETLIGAIASPFSGTGGGQSVLAAIKNYDGAPPAAMLLPLVSRLETAESGEVGELYDALARYPSKYAANALLAQTVGGGERATLAFTALRLLVGGGAGGLSGPGDDYGAWKRWLESFDDLNEVEWQRALLVNFERSHRTGMASLAASGARLAECARKLYIATGADERRVMLTELLGDRNVILQDLGFELAQREISNSAVLDPAVGVVALELLRDSSARVRSRAAVLLRQLAPAGTAEGVVAALKKETDPQAASDLLLAATRTPTPDAIDAVMEWLLSDSQAREAAVQACLQISRVMRLDDARQKQIVTLLRASLRAALAGMADDDVTNDAGGGAGTMPLTAAGVTLLADLGGDPAEISGLLEHPDITLRMAAADALVYEEAYRARLLDAAVLEPQLAAAAVRGVLVHTPDPLLFGRALALFPEAGADSNLRTLIMAAARQLPADQLLSALRACSTCPLRDELLASLLTADRVSSESSRPESLAAIREGALLLTKRYLDDLDAAGALVTLDAAAYLEGDPRTAREAAQFRLAALIGVGKLDAARAICAASTDPSLPRTETLMRGLQLTRGTAHVARAAELIFDVAGSRLSEGQRAAIEVLLGESSLMGPPAPVVPE